MRESLEPVSLMVSMKSRHSSIITILSTMSSLLVVSKYGQNNQWSVLLVISSGCGVLLLSQQIRVSSAVSRRSKVHSSAFIWFSQEETGSVNCKSHVLHTIAFPYFVLRKIIVCIILVVWAPQHSCNLVPLIWKKTEMSSADFSKIG